MAVINSLPLTGKYRNATPLVDGLLSKEDKIKLDKLDTPYKFDFETEEPKWVLSQDTGKYEFTITVPNLTSDMYGTLIPGDEATKQDYENIAESELSVKNNGDGTVTITSNNPIEVPLSLLYSTNLVVIEVPEIIKESTRTLDFTLYAADWAGENAPYTQKLVVEDLRDDMYGAVSLADGYTGQQLRAAIAAKILVDHKDNTITFTVTEEKPVIDIDGYLVYGYNVAMSFYPIYNIDGLVEAKDVPIDNTVLGLNEAPQNVEEAIKVLYTKFLKISELFQGEHITIENILTTSDIINNVESILANKPLSAYQGKLLNDKIDEVRNAIDSSGGDIKGDIKKEFDRVNELLNDVAYIVKGSIDDSTEVTRDADTLGGLYTSNDITALIKTVDKLNNSSLGGNSSYNDAYIDSLLDAKVDKVNGKGLSSNDYTNEDKAKLNSIDNKVDKADGKGLSSNDYTNEDKSKVASIDNKVDKVDGKGLSTNDYTNEDKAKLASLEDTKVDKENGKGLSTNDYTNKDKAEVAKISNKVDKVDGKGLSTNDYDDNEKAKVASIDNKVDKEDGKGLSSNDFTTTYINKINDLEKSIDSLIKSDHPEDSGTSPVVFTEATTFENIESGETTNVIFGKIKRSITELINHKSATNPHNITAATLGLNNLDNTSDENKPISKATQAALDTKADTTYVDTELAKKASSSELSSLSTTVDGKASKTYVDTELAKKASSSDVTAINKSLAAKADTTYVDTELAKKASSSELSSLSTTVDGKASKTYVDTELAKKASSSELSSLATTVDGKADSSEIATIKSNIGTANANIADLSKRIDGLSASSLPFINVLASGVTHDWADQTPVINQIIEDAPDNSVIYFPYGTYRIDSSIICKSNITLWGDNAIIINLGDCHTFYLSNYNDSTKLGPVDTAVNVEEVIIKGFEVRNVYDTKSAVFLRHVKNITISDMITNCSGVLANVAYNIGYNSDTCVADAGITSKSKVNNGIRISNLRCFRSSWDTTYSPDGTAKGINLEYCNDVFITNCLIDGFGQGIEMWGGNAGVGVGGLTTSDLFCSDILISNCIVRNISGGGIWGSMCKNMTIDNCNISNCLDVGADFEGCRESKAINCTISNCRFGNMAVYTKCRNILFANIISIQDSSDNWNTHLMTSMSSQNPYDVDIIIDGCQFISSNVIGELTFASCRNRIITNSYFKNVKITYNDGCVGFINSDTSNNRFYFDMNISNINILLSKSHNYAGYHTISNNKIECTGSVSNCNGIVAFTSDYNKTSNHVIKDNTIIGLTKGIYLTNESTNAGIKLYVNATGNVSNNISTNGNISITKANNYTLTGTAI